MKISILIPSGILLAVYWVRYFLTEKRKGVPLTVPLAFTCLFIPKINLFRINRTFSTAGFRTDDILALLLLTVAIRDAYTYKNRYIKRGIVFLAALTAANTVSMIMGRMNGYDNAILFSVLSIIRKYEYFAFVLIGIYIIRKTKNAENVLLEEFTWMSCFHVIIGLLQAAKVVDTVTSGVVGYTAKGWNGMAISTFNGHYEYGQFLCFGIVLYLCVFLRACKTRSVRKMILSGMMILVSGLMIWLTKSRTSLVGGIILIVLILLFSIRKDTSKPAKISMLTGIFLFITVGILFITGVLRIGRFKAVKLDKYANLLQTNIENGDLRSYAEVVRIEGMELSGMTERIKRDGSASVRFYRWGAALDGFRQYPVFGYGTGVTQVMDGNYVKLLGETGLAGTLLWLFMYGYYMKAVWGLRKKNIFAECAFWMMVSVLIGALFIDMFEASKSMEMLWMIIGLGIGAASMKSLQNNCFSGEKE